MSSLPLAETRTGAPALEIRDLKVSYGSSTALDGLNITVERGQVVALLGPSGCGKTTALLAVAGFVPVRSGRILTNGIDITNLAAPKRDLGVIFQEYALFPHMTVRQNIEYGLAIRKVANKAKRARSDELMGIVGLTEFADRKPAQLSGGQRQRVAVARALAIEPPVLLLDEPLANLDTDLRRVLLDELIRLREQSGITMLYVTHDRVEAFSLADEVAVMNGGRVEQLGAPMALYSAPSSTFVGRFMGEINVLSGTLVAPGPQSAQVTVGGTKLGGEFRAGDLKVGDRASVLFRPEDVVVGQGAGAAVNSIDAVVERVLLMGARARATLRVGDEVVTASMPSSGLQLEPGARVKASWPRELTSILAPSES